MSIDRARDPRGLRAVVVAAMAFPTRQGTQGLVREQCRSLSARGHDVHLVCYAASGYAECFPFVVHRVRGWPRLRSLRSGPLPQKPILDVRLAAAVRRLVRELGPDVVLAHHLEGLAACALPKVEARLVYHAHTRLDLELPTYGIPESVAAATAWVERALARRADAVVAVAPDLAGTLGGTYVPPSLAFDGPVVPGTPRTDVLYQGNLDAYQGLDVLIDAWARIATMRKGILRIATASSPTELVPAIVRRGLADRVRFEPLGDLLSARKSLAAAAAIAVPRATGGGFPIKLLEALASGRPVVVSRRAAHGLRDGLQALVVPDDDPRAFAAALESVLGDEGTATRLGKAGRTYALEHHGDAQIEALESVLRG